MANGLRRGAPAKAWVEGGELAKLTGDRQKENHECWICGNIHVTNLLGF